jgi:hypothetical protein
MLNIRRDHQNTEHLRLLDRLTVLSRVLAAALLYLSSYLTLFDASPRTLLAPSAVSSFASSLLRWDAFYFTSIAKDGYSYEHHWAFFPGVPLLLRVADRLPTLFLDDTTAATSWLALLNAAIAIPTTRAIYHLTLIHFRSTSFALLTAILSLLPASPVTLYFAPYAEPIFTFLSYQGMCTHLYTTRHVLTLCSGDFTHLRNARLCTLGLRSRFAVLLRRCRLPLKWRSACSLCPLVSVNRPSSPVFYPATPKRCVLCKPLCPAPALAVTPSPAPRLPHLLPRRRRNRSLTTSMVQ